MESHKHIPTKEVSLRDYEIKVVDSFPKDKEIEKNTIYIQFKTAGSGLDASRTIIGKFKTSDRSVQEYSIDEKEIINSIKNSANEEIIKHKEPLLDGLTNAFLSINLLNTEFGFQPIHKKLLVDLIKEKIVGKAEPKKIAEKVRRRRILSTGIPERTHPVTTSTSIITAKPTPENSLRQTLSTIKELIFDNAHGKRKGESNVLLAVKELDEVISNKVNLEILKKNPDMQEIVKSITTATAYDYAQTITAQVVDYFQGKDPNKVKEDEYRLDKEELAKLQNSIGDYAVFEIIQKPHFPNSTQSDIAYERWIYIANILHEDGNYFAAEAIMQNFSALELAVKNQAGVSLPDRLSKQGRQFYDKLNDFYGSLTMERKVAAYRSIVADKKNPTKISSMAQLSRNTFMDQETLKDLESEIKAGATSFYDASLRFHFVVKDSLLTIEEIEKKYGVKQDDQKRIAEKGPNTDQIKERYNIPPEEDLDLDGLAVIDKFPTLENLLKGIQQKRKTITAERTKDLISVNTEKKDYDHIPELGKYIFETKSDEAIKKFKDTVSSEATQKLVDPKNKGIISKEAKEMGELARQCNFMYGYNEKEFSILHFNEYSWRKVQEKDQAVQKRKAARDANIKAKDDKGKEKEKRKRKGEGIEGEEKVKEVKEEKKKEEARQKPATRQKRSATVVQPRGDQLPVRNLSLFAQSPEARKNVQSKGKEKVPVPPKGKEKELPRISSSSEAESSSSTASISRNMVANGGQARQQRIDDENKLLNEVQNGNLDGVKNLLAKGVDPNTVNSKGETLLHLAVAKGNREMVKELLVNGADPNIVVKETGETPLHLAVKKGKLSILDQLLNTKKLLQEKEEKLNQGIKESKEIVERSTMIIETSEVGDRKAARHMEIKKENEDKIKELNSILETTQEEFKKTKKVKINMQDNNGNTALHYAARGDGIVDQSNNNEVKYTNLSRMINLLLEAGADHTIKNAEQNTPLQLVEKIDFRKYGETKEIEESRDVQKKAINKLKNKNTVGMFIIENIITATTSKHEISGTIDKHVLKKEDREKIFIQNKAILKTMFDSLIKEIKDHIKDPKSEIPIIGIIDKWKKKEKNKKQLLCFVEEENIHRTYKTKDYMPMAEKFINDFLSKPEIKEQLTKNPKRDKDEASMSLVEHRAKVFGL